MSDIELRRNILGCLYEAYKNDPTRPVNVAVYIYDKIDQLDEKELFAELEYLNGKGYIKTFRTRGTIVEAMITTEGIDYLRNMPAPNPDDEIRDEILKRLHEVYPGTMAYYDLRAMVFVSEETPYIQAGSHDGKEEDDWMKKIKTSADVIEPTPADLEHLSDLSRSLDLSDFDEFDRVFEYLRDSGHVDKKDGLSEVKITAKGIDKVQPSKYSSDTPSVQVTNITNVANITIENFFLNIEQAIKQANIPPEEKKGLLKKLKELMSHEAFSTVKDIAVGLGKEALKEKLRKIGIELPL